MAARRRGAGLTPSGRVGRHRPVLLGPRHLPPTCAIRMRQAHGATARPGRLLLTWDSSTQPRSSRCSALRRSSSPPGSSTATAVTSAGIYAASWTAPCSRPRTGGWWRRPPPLPTRPHSTPDRWDAPPPLAGGAQPPLELEEPPPPPPPGGGGVAVGPRPPREIARGVRAEGGDRPHAGPHPPLPAARPAEGAAARLAAGTSDELRLR